MSYHRKLNDDARKSENAIEHKLFEYSHQSRSHKVRAGAVLEREHQGLARGAHSPPRSLPAKAEAG